MAYKLYNTTQGQFCVDWETCCQIIRNYYRSASQLRNAKDVRESERGWNPFSRNLPDLTYLDVDWRQVHRDTEGYTAATAWRLAAIANFDRHGIDRLVSELKGMQADTRRANAAFCKRQRDTGRKSALAISNSVASYQRDIDIARVTRDLSGSVLIGAATVATAGGASGAALLGSGLGTAIKTTAAYQNTGSMGVAAMEATQNIVLYAIPAARGAALSGSEKVLKVVLAGVLDTDKAVLQGSRLSAALEKGAVGAAVSAAGGPMKRALGGLLDRTAVPVLAKVLSTSTRTASEYASGIAAKVTQDFGKKALQGGIGDNGGLAPHQLSSKSHRHSWASAMSFSDYDGILLKLAVIDMVKGVGRSWW